MDGNERMMMAANKISRLLLFLPSSLTTSMNVQQVMAVKAELRRCADTSNEKRVRLASSAIKYG